jgi:small subunit ribosomal protein S1
MPKKEGRESGGMEELLIDYERTFKKFEDGDIVSGEVVRIDRDEILVDIGYKSEGAIPLRELSIRHNVKPEEIVSIGDRIEAMVLQKEDQDGRLILSKKRAEFERAWVDIEKIAAEDGTVKGEVIEVVKGGLILDIGLRGFLPASLVELRRVKNLGDYMGQELECKVIEMDRSRNNVVLSRRAVLESERRQERRKILSSIEKGQILTGRISSIVDFGAFVDLGGIDGLIHISELCWDHIDHPSEVVSIGDEVKVQVLEVDCERERISLGLKQTQGDPWVRKVAEYRVGDVIEGKICNIVSFGAFVEICEGIEGLIHISELSEERVGDINSLVKLGEVIKAKIIDIDCEKHHISLSIKQLNLAFNEEEGQIKVDFSTEQAARPKGRKKSSQKAESRSAAKQRSKMISAEAKTSVKKTSAKRSPKKSRGAESNSPATAGFTSVNETGYKVQTLDEKEHEETVKKPDSLDKASLEEVLEEMRAARGHYKENN